MQINCFIEISRYTSAPTEHTLSLRINGNRLSVVDLGETTRFVTEDLAIHYDLLDILVAPIQVAAVHVIIELFWQIIAI
ncbi:hypothetical protein SB85_01440 [Xanthomonas sacchari]|nr:hypothetical protein SB85_01440 [Xanthomonas sacchari]